MFFTRLFRRAEVRRRMRQARAVRRKASAARQVVAGTDAMLARHPNPRRNHP